MTRMIEQQAAEIDRLRALCKKALDAWTGDGPPIDLDELRAALKESEG